MRPMYPWLLASALTLLTAGNGWAQAGRYVPIEPPGGGGRFVPMPFLDNNPGVFWCIVGVGGVFAAGFGGWKLGYGVGRLTRGLPWDTGPALFPATPPAPEPPTPDLILSPEAVADRARETTGLLETLGRQDPVCDPAALRAFITTTFEQVQRCWQERDYGPVRPLLFPGILGEHEALLRAMRRNREINRIEDLQVRRLEFVHVCCPAELDRQEVTALITFAAKVYFVAEETGGFLRGKLEPDLFQELWTFGRKDNAWRLQTIERSHVSSRLRAPNSVAG